jgi:hypothetical protein
MADAEWERRLDLLSPSSRPAPTTSTTTCREREAVSLALTALAAHLPRYNRSLVAYAGELA